MHLYVSLVPPLRTVQALTTIVRDVQVEVGPTESRHRIGLPRQWAFLGRRNTTRLPMIGMLHAVAASELRADVIGFGNLTRGDANRLVNALEIEADAWPSFRLRVTGGAALEWPGDEAVWAKLEGQIDELSLVARGIPTVAQRVQLYVDRRRYRPMIKLGTITDKTSATYLEQLIADLDEFEGEWWTQSTLPVWQLVQGDRGAAALKLYAEVPLGG